MQDSVSLVTGYAQNLYTSMVWLTFVRCEQDTNVSQENGVCLRDGCGSGRYAGLVSVQYAIDDPETQHRLLKRPHNLSSVSSTSGVVQNKASICWSG